MSEFWISKKKYFCKYCDIYIADDAPSRQQHENGLRHQGNKARFVRDLYKTSERKKRDLEEEKRELVRVEQAANEAYAKDILSGDAKLQPVASTSRAAPSAARAPPRSSDPYANYSTAESLGFVDHEALRLAEEKALKLNEGRIGEWTTVAVQLPPASASLDHNNEASPVETPAVEDQEDTRGWKLDGSKRRRIAVGLGDIYDPGVIKVKRKEGDTPAPDESKTEEEAAEAEAKLLPKWTPKVWQRPGEAPPPGTTDAASGKHDALPEEPAVKKEEDDSPSIPGAIAASVEPAPVVKAETPSLDTPPPADPAPSSSGMFRKRKAPGTGAGSRGSRR